MLSVEDVDAELLFNVVDADENGSIDLRELATALSESGPANFHIL